MRLLLIAPFALYPKGTTRGRVLPLAHALAAQGHAVQVLVPPYDWPAHSGRRVQADGVEIVHLPVGERSSMLGQVRLGTALAQAAQAWRPDVVHVFKPKGPGGIAARLLLSRGLPVMVDTDDYEAGWNAAAGYPAVLRLAFRWQERDLLRRGYAVTAASRWLCQFAASLGQQRVTYLPNGVDLSRSEGLFVAPPLSDTASSARRVLLYTRFVEHSAAEVWDVWRGVVAQHPRAELWVVGQGMHGEEAELQRLARKAGAEGSIRCLGWLPVAAQSGLFAAVDVALLPVRDCARNRAKSPLRLLELLAHGVPVATQRVGEYGLYIQHDVSGLLAEPDDAAGLAGHVLRLLAEPTLRAHLAAAARAYVGRQHAWTRLAERIVYHPHIKSKDR
ncbi:MAG: glycosyltransferase family 4 protein [Caldilineales bacterium]